MEIGTKLRLQGVSTKVSLLPEDAISHAPCRRNLEAQILEIFLFSMQTQFGGYGHFSP